MSLSSKKSGILIVDDHSCSLDLVCKIITKAGFVTNTAIDGIDAIEQVKSKPPELILLDGVMPNLDGFETCRLLKQNPATRSIPIIFMSALTETEKKVKAFNLGVSDYITKPFQKGELLARVKHQMELVNLRQTLENQNYLLQHEVNQKYEAEITLLETNERLAKANKYLALEIENRKLVEKEIQTEIVERKQAENEVKQSLKEKNLLLKEIHHRVKNNLFIVSSLLESQADYIDNPQALKMLNDSQNRIMSMALIHEQLHGGTGLFQIDFQQYLTTLIDYLIDSYLTNTITVKANIQPVPLNLETANPCGLIVNELISNAVEHAFVGRDKGNITLDFYSVENQKFALIVKDDGIGVPDPENFLSSESLGLELVSTLVEQLEGAIEVRNDNGTEIKIIFEELKYDSRI